VEQILADTVYASVQNGPAIWVPGRMGKQYTPNINPGLLTIGQILKKRLLTLIIST